MPVRLTARYHRLLPPGPSNSRFITLNQDPAAGKRGSHQGKTPGCINAQGDVMGAYATSINQN
jgi:hypothetical protein